MNYETILTLTRTVLYVWVGVEYANLAFIYWQGYLKIRPTAIIRSLRTSFVFLSILFLTMAFLPMLLVLDAEVHMYMVNVLPIFLFPVAFSARRFRSESFKKQFMELPDKSKV